MTVLPGGIQERVADYLKIISDLDDELHIWQEVFFDAAAERARLLDAQEAVGSLHGIVVGVKDIFDFEGKPPGNGSVVTPATTPERNSSIVQALLDEDAVIIGTTKLTEFCYLQPTSTKNPHNVRHTPGGSSSGSAAAVAAGMAQLTVGSQTKGSTIRPASFCGVYGFKPSYGLISMAGSTRLTTSMDHPGFLADSPRTLERVFSALTDNGRTKEVTGASNKSNNGCIERIGYVDLAKSTDITVDGDMEAKFRSYLSELARLGYDLTEIELPFRFQEIDAVWQEIFYPEAYANLGYLQHSSEYQRLGSVIRGVIEKGQVWSQESYARSLEERVSLGNRMAEALSAYDILLLPSALGAAPRGLASTGDPTCTVFTSLLGLPAGNVPMGCNDRGLPLGLQVVSTIQQDRKVLSALSKLPATTVRPSVSQGN